MLGSLLEERSRRRTRGRGCAPCHPADEPRSFGQFQRGSRTLAWCTAARGRRPTTGSSVATRLRDDLPDDVAREAARREEAHLAQALGRIGRGLAVLAGPHILGAG